MTRRSERESSVETDAEERILIAWIGECEENPVPWFRELIGVDGARYRIYHRRGRMYCANLETGDILFDRDEGGPDAVGGPDETILKQSSDFFRKLTRGKPCPVCGAIYPADNVPYMCFKCETTLRNPDVVSLLPLECKRLPIPLDIHGSELKHSRASASLDTNDISKGLEKGPITGGWVLRDEFGNEYWAIVTANFVAGVRVEQDDMGNKIARFLKGYPLLDEEIDTFAEYMLNILVLEEGAMRLELDFLKCRNCDAFKPGIDAPCAACGDNGDSK